MPCPVYRRGTASQAARRTVAFRWLVRLLSTSLSLVHCISPIAVFYLSPSVGDTARFAREQTHRRGYTFEYYGILVYGMPMSVKYSLIVSFQPEGHGQSPLRRHRPTTTYAMAAPRAE
ncbi:hypothetical protein C8Q72DRAFT_844252 [Fomitopsis betulina]|nr:hypothetical protein C8Q72DRAFT_844252 [Fomitopsis betulina]